MLQSLPQTFHTLSLLILLTCTANAHDIWLYAEDFRMDQGDRLVLHQVSGHGMDRGMEFELLLDMTPSFQLHTPDGQRDLLEGLGRTREVITPILDTIVDFNGPALITMQHDFIYTQWKSHEFTSYLHHEGLADKFHGTFPSKEIYSERYARSFKCLVQSSDASGDVYKRLIGQDLEIILLQNPYTLDPGDRLEFQVYYNGQPAANQQVKAMAKQPNGQLTSLDLCTDTKGQASFLLAHQGTWLLRSLYLFRNSTGDTDWESHWTSFTFAVD
jgi:uncharacterized GH25 family protein